VGEFEAAVVGQLTACQQAHQVQQTDLLLRSELQRPNRPQHSSAILNSRKIEEALVKQVCGRFRICARRAAAAHRLVLPFRQPRPLRVLPTQSCSLCPPPLQQGEYRRAHEVKISTDELYRSELAAAQDTWELGVELQRGKLIAKQQGAVAGCERAAAVLPAGHG
jgi:hypothetical protein